MNPTDHPSWIAFARNKCIARGTPREVAAAAKRLAGDDALVFDAQTSEPIEIDLRGSLAAVLKRLPDEPSTDAASDQSPSTPAHRTAGRPRLGVIAREVTLLPRHWDWLASQPGGASVALRKLVESGMRANREADRVRQARESAYRFMHAMAGNHAGFEEATRALFAGNLDALQGHIAKWPRDVRRHAEGLAVACMAHDGESSTSGGASA